MNSGPEIPLDIDVEVLIPVYGNLDLVENCLESLVAQETRGIEISVTLLDDGMSILESRALSLLASRFSCRILRSPTNLGFRRVVNLGFAQMRSSLVLLLNSDVELPPWGIQSLVSTALTDHSIALVSPLATSGTPLSVELEPGQSWLSFARELRGRPRTVLDACTTVGYCLLIRSELVERPLFSDDLPEAYGEDTDLHFRVVSNGHRAVVDANCYIFHKGSASYDLTHEHEQLRDRARLHFNDNWLSTWESQFPLFEAKLTQFAEISGGTQVEAERPLHNRVAFISPGHEFDRNGGLSVIRDLALYTSTWNPDSVIASLALGPGEEPPWVEQGIRAINYRGIGSAEVVVATAPWTWPTALSIAQRRPSTALVTLLQGMDYLLNPMHAANMLQMLRSSDAIIATSDYLESFARRVGANRILRIDVRPNPLAFVRRSPIQDIDVLFSVRDTPLKGSELSAGFAALLSGLGYRVAVMGGSSIELPSEVLRWPWPDRPALSHAMSRARVYVDMSLTEGYGLQPREARLSGCSVVVLRSGGVLDEFSMDPKVRVLPEPSDPNTLLSAVEELLEMDSEFLTDLELAMEARPSKAKRFKEWISWLELNQRLRTTVFEHANPNCCSDLRGVGAVK